MLSVAIGTKRTSRDDPLLVRFRAQSGHDSVMPLCLQCLLLTQSGHTRPNFAVMHNAAFLIRQG
jgi:hypothetical protein